jgi:hypothetical protein
VSDSIVAGGGRSIRALLGSGDTAWVRHTDGVVLTAVSHGASLFVGGRFSVIDDVAHDMVAKLDPSTGAVDTGWALEPVPFSDAGEGAFAVDLLLDGSALFVAAGGADYAARFELASGALTWWTDTSGSVQAVELLDATTLAIGGHFQWVADEDTRECGTNVEPVTTCTSRPRLGALDATTGALLGWDPEVTGHYSGVWALDLDASGRLHVGGAFTHVGGEEQWYYARLSAG